MDNDLFDALQPKQPHTIPRFSPDRRLGMSEDTPDGVENMDPQKPSLHNLRRTGSYHFAIAV